MIWNVVAIAAARYLFRLGLMPKGAIIRRSLAALKKDNLDLAVNSYFDVARRDFSSEKVQVLREILISEIGFRKKVLQKRIEMLPAEPAMAESTLQRELEGCRQAVRVLDEYLGRLGASPGESSRQDSPG